MKFSRSDFRFIAVTILGIVFLAGVPASKVTIRVKGVGVWSSDGRIYFPEKLANHILKQKTHGMVMVSFKPNSSFSHSVFFDQRTYAFYSNPSSGIGRAVLIINDSKERDEIASAAHENTGACGSIEILDAEYPLSSDDLGDALSPIVPTSVKSTTLLSRLNEVSSDNIKSTTQTLENMGTRYHAGSTPNTVSDAVKSSWQALAPPGAIVSQFDHSANGYTNQKSVILALPAIPATNETVVIGAHIDSINRNDQTKAPGADDDATGVAALTEMIRIVKANNMQFKRNIEFHAYAAEESGLVGSKEIAAKAQSDGKKITSMLQLDMIGYSASPDERLHIITTDTSPVLVRHLKDLATVYLGGNWKEGTLAGGTSDHKSWTSRGFHSAFAFENPADYNQALHTENDTISRLNFSLAAKFTKLAFAFLGHEAGYNSSVSDTESQWKTQESSSSLIKLASVKSPAGGDRLAAAVDGPATSAEFCKIKSGTEVGCQSMVTDTTLEKQKSNRVFFLSESDLTINEDDIWRVSAYSSSGELIGMRRMRLKKN